MQYRELGKTGERVSILGFGTMRLPVLDGDEGRIDEPEATRMLNRAIELGVNYIDTAWPYHRRTSEPWVGQALAGGLRDEVHLATKLPAWTIKNREDCDEYLNRQLELLKTDHVDFYMLHSLIGGWWRALLDMDVLEFLDSALTDGRIRYAGFSFHDDLSLFREIVDSYDWSFCQIQFNYMDEMYQAGIGGLKYAAGKDIGVVVMEPLRGGALAAKMPRDITAIMESTGVSRTPAEWGLRWVWNHPEVSLLLSGMTTMDQVEENAATASDAAPGSLSDEDLSVISQVRDKYREREMVPCTVCNYCMPCPEGVNIPKILTLYNNASIYDDPVGPAEYYRDMMDREEWATNCVECGDCEEVCPQQIRIIETLKDCHDSFTSKSGS